MAWTWAGAAVLLILGLWLIRRRGSAEKRIDRLIAEGRERHAIDLLDRRLPHSSGADRAELLRRRGECHGMLGDLRAASRDFESCLELQPDRTDHWEKLALIYRLLGRKEAAERCVQRVLELQGSACPNVGPHD